MTGWRVARVLFGVVAAVMVALPAWAIEDSSSIGGATLQTDLHGAQTADRYQLMRGGGFAAGVTVTPSAQIIDIAPPLAGVGGYVSFAHDFYRIDASLHPYLVGGMAADLFAGVGAAPGTPGTSYGLVLGASKPSPLSYGVPAGERLGLTSLDGFGSDVKLGFTVNRVLESGVSLVGTATARHGIAGASGLDAGYSPTELMVGAGLGFHF